MLSNAKIHDVYRNAFVMMTEKMAGFTIKDDDSKKSRSSYPYRILIQSKGNFQSDIVCYMEGTLYEAVLMGMNAGKNVNADLKSLFIGEYMNVICGHALTSINNLLGRHSRLTVPKMIQKETCLIEQENAIVDVLYFTSAYGGMKVNICYTEKEEAGNVLI